MLNKQFLHHIANNYYGDSAEKRNHA